MGENSKLLHREACDTLVKESVSLQLVNKNEICGTNGCYQYDPKRDVHLNSCPVCNGPRTTKNEMKTVKIADKLSELLACDDIRERLAYRHNNYPKDKVLSERNTNGKVYNDAFDGDRYAKLVEEGRFDNKFDLALKLDVDGFRSKYSSTKMIMIHCVVLNYDISEVSSKKKIKN